MDVKNAVEKSEWSIVKTLVTEGQQEELFPFDDLPLSQNAKRYLSLSFSNGLYFHQKRSIEQYLREKHVCLATRTASGKSAAFYTAGVNELSRNPSAKIIAIYPTRALGDEQQHRWQSALDGAGLNSARVGRIDGSVKPISRRLTILKESSVLICTPDILHAWLLSHLNEKEIVKFLRTVSLIVVDEVHTYTGVFGSNAAFLFRRLRHLMSLLDNTPRFIAASATIRNPENHLHALFGLDFVVIGEEDDTSPRYPLEIHLANPPGNADFLTEIVTLLAHLSTLDGSRFITFVDSRKQVELISSILSRGTEPVSDDASDNDDGDPHGINSDILNTIQVLPYRAGYEEYDRRLIQERLSHANLKGVISTSGLELGIDIPHLNTCVLVGVPASATSLYQRIGRVGRNEKGYVVVVNTGDAHSEAIFAKPETFLQRPLGESALYLENEYLQYIHALCLARLDGEHDQVAQNNNEVDFASAVSWPSGFIDFCKMERLGQVPKRLQFMKSEAGDSPNYVYPLRDVESQFHIEYKRGPDRTSLGSLSYSQLMREAYPGAVYYYATQPYRVYRVKQRSREVLVRKEKRYTTKPQKLPTLVFPNLTDDNILNSFSYGDILLIECNLQIRESIKGIRERRGPNVTDYSYPLPSELGFYFDKNFFTRNFFTTGVVITHPILRNTKFDVRVSLAGLLYEVFLLLVPFERQDSNYATDKYRMEIAPLIRKMDPFIAIYDQTYGSLRLTSRLMRDEVIPHLFETAYDLVSELDYGDESPELLEVLDTLIQESRKGATKIRFETNESKFDTGDVHSRRKVIVPGSKGLNINRDNEEFFVARVFLTSSGLRYEGETETFSKSKDKTASYPLVDDIVPIPGVSQMGYFDELTGEVVPIEQVTAFHTVLPPGQERQRIEVEKLKFVLNAYFTEAHLQYLCKKIGLIYDDIQGINKLEKVHYIVSYCDARGLSQNLLEAAYKLAMKLHGE